MVLEDLLRPFKWADQEVLASVTKFAHDRNLAEGKKKYHMGNLLWYGSISSVLARSIYLRELNFLYLYAEINDCLLNIKGIGKREGGEDLQNTDGTRTRDFVEEHVMARSRAMRLPILLSGLAFLAKAGYDAVHLFTTGDAPEIPLPYTIHAGIGPICLAASMYLKDQDPKLLKRKPAWEQARDYIRKAIAIPVPGTVPAPARY